MRHLLDDLERWYADGRTFALATVVATLRSAPRDVGAVMAVGAGGEVLGSVSGGCVEGAVYALAREVIASGRPELAGYGVTREDALMAGLTCGGTLEVFVEPIDPARRPDFPALVAAVRAGTPMAAATVVSSHEADRVGMRALVGPAGSGGTGPLADAARELLGRGESGLLVPGAGGGRIAAVSAAPPGDVVFVHAHVPRPLLLVFGSNDYAAAVARAGALAGFRVTVCDARPVFTTPERFPGVDDLVVEWPDRYLSAVPVDARTAVCVLTHDPKFDVPVLVRALRTEAGYIGAMGSRRAHRDRLVRLREEGLTERELARLHSPIGLDLGARTPEETAIAVLAEIVQCRRGGSGKRLVETDGRIHGGR
ncbi:XdhC family protein [Streptomyces sp. NPDC048506]|uniref:XdhC family protein n=1 Tax=Streptomyces sp. NPDC048506 TaxID=3155028 RepID=UPI00342E6988